MKKETTKYINCALDIEAIKKYVSFLREIKAPYTLTMSSYTTTIKSEFVNIRFMKEEKKMVFFARSKELKKEVANFLENNIIDNITSVEYYDIAEHKDFIQPEVFNVDLSSAYLYVLKNNNIISNTLFEKLFKMEKQDRLAIVGMLASKKQVFTFDESGEISNYETIEEPEQRNIFFFCVYTVYFIMQEIKKMLGVDYIFTWVDGIYFVNGEHLPKIEKFLNSINYPFKIETLTNFEFYKNEKNIIEIDFLKNNKKKTFNIPIEKNNTFANELYNFINDQHKKQTV